MIFSWFRTRVQDPAFELPSERVDEELAAVTKEACRLADERAELCEQLDEVRRELRAHRMFAPAAPLRDVVGAVRELVRATGETRARKEALQRMTELLEAELRQVRGELDVAKFRPSDSSAQDRRNAVLLTDALAVSEGRTGGAHAPLADERAARALRNAVRRTVEEHLRLPEGALS